MSRVAKSVIPLPSGIDLNLQNDIVKVSGPMGQLELGLHSQVELKIDSGIVSILPKNSQSKEDWSLAGTMRALINNMVIGAKEGFEKRLQLVGVGYRAQMQGQILNLALGFSHPIQFNVPDGIKIDTPTQTEIIIKGSDKQKVGQVAAVIRGFRRPDPYKGKGVRYLNEKISLKEAKKK